ncbi:MAG: hypothetical protein KIT22_06595, partial [Verrucomicrobiae bacterium]|nr:hypothetical protein [Verrucomicrobiae bacterium]
MRYACLLFLLGLVLPMRMESAEPAPSALGSINAAELLGDIRVLSGDDMEGRAPGSAGEERATAWIAEQFRAAGLQPGASGGWFQSVPVVGVQSAVGITLQSRGTNEVLQSPQDFVAWAAPQREHVSVGN